uniref:Uncharacterized protein n=1 Tax=Arcella intermedia TaxID=1963864 RepID=A0A6B2LM38_9EUKA
MKVIFVGNYGVGKTNLLRRLEGKQFEENQIMSNSNLNFPTKLIQVGTTTLNLELWDPSGHERFKRLFRSFYADTQGCLIVFDICDPLSFTSVQEWFDDVTVWCGKQVVRVLVGSKCDLEGERKVTSSEAEAFAEKLGIPYIETSSKNGTNVNEMTVLLAHLLVEVK